MAAYCKTLLINGFNVMGSKPVFDGIHLHAGHAGVLPLMKSGVGPRSVSGGVPTFATPNFVACTKSHSPIGILSRRSNPKGRRHLI